MNENINRNKGNFNNPGNENKYSRLLERQEGETETEI